MPKYRVSVAEKWIRDIYIDADNPEQALEKIEKNDYTEANLGEATYLSDLEGDVEVYGEDGELLLAPDLP